jgi:hypothetical protein
LSVDENSLLCAVVGGEHFADLHARAAGCADELPASYLCRVAAALRSSLEDQVRLCTG